MTQQQEDWVKEFREKWPILLDQGGEFNGKPILTDDVTEEVISFISTLLAKREKANKIKGAEEYFELIDKEFESFKIDKEMGEVLQKYRILVQDTQKGSI